MISLPKNVQSVGGAEGGGGGFPFCLPAVLYIDFLTAKNCRSVGGGCGADETTAATVGEVTPLSSVASVGRSHFLGRLTGFVLVLFLAVTHSGSICSRRSNPQTEIEGGDE